MIKRNLKWLRLLAILPLVCVLVITNIYEDPANIFHNVNESAAAALMDGNEVYFGSGNCDERAIRKHMIELMPDEVE